MDTKHWNRRLLPASFAVLYRQQQILPVHWSASDFTALWFLLSGIKTCFHSCVEKKKVSFYLVQIQSVYIRLWFMDCFWVCTCGILPPGILICHYDEMNLLISICFERGEKKSQGSKIAFPITGRFIKRIKVCRKAIIPFSLWISSFLFFFSSLIKSQIFIITEHFQPLHKVSFTWLLKRAFS